MVERALPTWSTGTPPAPGYFIAFAAIPGRKDAAGLYHWDGELWTHWSGWHDCAVTHWMPSDLPSDLSKPADPASRLRDTDKGEP